MISKPTIPTQTRPVDEAKRLAASEIKIEIAEEKDARRIAEGLYACYPASAVDKIEPPHLRPPNFEEVRVQRLAKRFQPTFTQPGITWIKAVHIPTNTIIGTACWTGPNAPIVCPNRRDAFTYYGWGERLGWSDAEIDELFAHVDQDAWSGRHERDDAVRSKLLGEEPHWYLSLLLTWPEWQGRGVAKRLLNWATEQADAESPPIPMYLETSAMARVIYEHVGFVQQGEGKVYLRRGPKVVAKVKRADEQAKMENKPDKVDVKNEARELETETAS